MQRQSILVHGLRLVLRHPGALVWTFAANLTFALLFALALHAQLADILNHSLAAERLNTAFDLDTLGAAVFRIAHHNPTTGAARYLGIPVAFLVNFLLVPGALFTYRVAAPGRLGILLSSGLCFFWRFVRIALLSALAFLLLLGPLFAIQLAWSNYLDEHVLGIRGFSLQLAGVLLILLVASLIRLYFDLVEVYTVQLDDRYLPNGKPDRRVRKTLLPALRTLSRNLPRAWASFLLIALFGLAAVFLTGRIALHTLAQPRVWPQFLLFQLGFFLNTLARFWQRGAETRLAEQHPLPGTSQLLESNPLLNPNCAAPIARYAEPDPPAPSDPPKRTDSGIFRVYPPPSPPGSI